MKKQFEKSFPSLNKSMTGRRIKEHMNRLGVSVEDLRSILKIGTVQSIYHWIEGKSFPSLDNLYALSVLFNVPVDALLCGNYDKNKWSYSGQMLDRQRKYLQRIRHLVVA